MDKQRQAGRGKARRPKIIQDKKQRGEWAESVFLARASEEGLPASKPWGESRSFDCVVGHPGKFLAVQVKCTISELKEGDGEGYCCSTSSCHKAYRPGAFDFLAAYVIPQDVWYIIPAAEIGGKKSISLCTQKNEGRYEPYREAWHLLREQTNSSQPAVDHAENTASIGKQNEVTAPASPRFPATAFGRMEAAFSLFRRRVGENSANPNRDEDR